MDNDSGKKDTQGAGGKEAVHGLDPADSAAGKFGPRATVRYFDMGLSGAKRFLTPPRFDFAAHWSVLVGHYALLAAQVLCVVIGLAAAIKFSAWESLFGGIGSALLLLVLQYTASRFLNAGDALIRSSPSRLASVAFLDCLALLVEALGIYLLVSGILQRDWTAFAWGLGEWALCGALAYVALNPRMANTVIAEGLSAGEEALGILSFLIKAVVGIIPVVFGVGAIIGAVALVASLFPLLGESGDPTAALSATKATLRVACLPFAGYLAFVLYHLGLDLMRAVLAVPGKLDALTKKRD